MRTATVLAAVLLASELAAGDPIITYAEVPYTRPAMDLLYSIPQYEQEGHRVYDLVVDAGPDDYWTGAEATAEIMSKDYHTPHHSFFWDHYIGDDDLPRKALILSLFGLTAYDTFWTGTEDYPNPDLQPDTQNVTLTDSFHGQVKRYAEWQTDTEPPIAYGGPYTIARYNLVGYGCQDSVPFPTPWGVVVSLEISGSSYFASTGDTPHPFHISIPLFWQNVPEPTSLALLVLGGAILVRRR